MNNLASIAFLLGGIYFALEARRELPIPYLTGMVRCFLLSCEFPQITVKQILGWGQGGGSGEGADPVECLPHVIYGTAKTYCSASCPSIMLALRRQK